MRTTSSWLKELQFILVIHEISVVVIRIHKGKLRVGKLLYLSFFIQGFED